jgi:hypothetical protein
MPDSIHVRSRARDAGLAAVNRWTRRAVAGGVVLSGLLAASLAHLLPGQATAARHESRAPAGTTSPTAPGTTSPSTPAKDRSDDSDDHAEPTGGTSRLSPPAAAPRPSHHSSPHVTSGGS